MKKILFSLCFVLGVSLSVGVSLAAEDSGNWAPGELNNVKCPDAVGGVVEAAFDESDSSIKDKFTDQAIETDFEKCGVARDGFLNKADCTGEGKVITEISEPVGLAPKKDIDGNKIIDVYKGTCCNITKKISSGSDLLECKEAKSIYTETYEACNKTAKFCTHRQWVIGTSGVGILKVFVKQVYLFFVALVGSMTLFTLITSGIQISVSGVSGDISQAKTRIMQAIAGMVLLFLSGIILYTINPTFFS